MCNYLRKRLHWSQFWHKEQHWRWWFEMFLFVFSVTQQFGITWSLPFHMTVTSQNIGWGRTSVSVNKYLKKRTVDDEEIALLVIASSFLALSFHSISMRKPTQRRPRNTTRTRRLLMNRSHLSWKRCKIRKLSCKKKSSGVKQIYMRKKWKSKKKWRKSWV